MELTESIESINSQLKDLFGIDTITGLPIWRISFSDTQREKRLMDTTESGFQLLIPQVREVSKYPWIKAKYILERLVVIPEINRIELPENKISYEPLWVFQDGAGNYLPPKLEASKFIINLVYAAQGKSNLAKYKDNPIEDQQRDIAKIEAELYGNETDVTDALAYKEGVVVPSNFKVN